MKSHFSSGFFQGNRQRLRAKLPQDYPIVLGANGVLQITNDTSFPFKQESNFWYLTGLDEPDITLVMTKNDEFLIIPTQSLVKDIFDGAIDINLIRKRSGIKQIYYSKEGWEHIKISFRKVTHIYTLLPEPAYNRSHVMYTNPAPRAMLNRLKRNLGNITTLDVHTEIGALRVIKQTPEIKALEHAVTITKETINTLRHESELMNFSNEYELEAAITAGFRSRGASGHAYAPIVAGGKNATTLHSVRNNTVLKSGSLIVLDVGAEVEHYAADITRTLSSRELTRRQAAVVQEVRRIQMAVLNRLRPGILPREYEGFALKEMGNSLVTLGLITNKGDRDGIRKYYPHATGHYLGLDVHDVGDYHQPLQENTVLTCEPGIYVPEEGLGVRLEDDVIITKTGNRVLGGDCSHDGFTL